MAETKEPCIIGEYCHRHGFIHGAEAEELRERLEALKKPSVQRILDDVDARDSCAYVEIMAEKERESSHV
jgi:hypothetical protein